MNRVAIAVVVSCFFFVSAKADESTSALTSTSTPEAERAFDAIRAAARGTDDARTEELARQFLLRFPRDPLAARAEIELGRLYLLHAMPTPGGGDQTAYAEGLARAESYLERASRHADAPTAIRVALYRGVLAYLRDDDEAAVALLEPIAGSIVDPDDQRLELVTRSAACSDLDRLDCVLDTLDALRASCRDAEECSDVDARMQELDRAGAEQPRAVRWVLENDPTRPSWPALASRVLRVLEARGELETIRAIVLRAAEADVELDAEGRAVVARAERGHVANPRVIGVVAGLSGPNAAASLAVVRAIASAAGMPPTDRIASDAYRFDVRDHHGSPEEAARAVVDLVMSSRAIAIIGPTDTASAEVAAARAEAIGVPFLSLAPVTQGRFVVDATHDRPVPGPLAEAERRFGAELGVLLPRDVATDAIPASRRFVHVSGRIDRATGVRIRESNVRSMFLDARPREVRRAVASLLPLLARPRGERVTLVLSRSDYERLPPGMRGLEGAVVLDVGESPDRLPAADAARAAFERIESVRATTREELAERLSASIPSTTDRAQAFVVRQGRLVATP